MDIFEQTRRELARTELERETARRKARYDALRAQFTMHRDAYRTWDAQCAARHRDDVREFRQRRAAEKQREADEQLRAEAARQHRTTLEAADTLHNLDDFEFTLRRLGRDGTQEAPALVAKHTIRRGDTNKTNDEMIAAIRARKEEDIRARRERLQRQFRMETEQAKVSDDMARLKERDDVLARARKLAEADRAQALEHRLKILQKRTQAEDDAEYEEGCRRRIAAEAALVDARTAITAAQQRAVANEEFASLRSVKVSQEQQLRSVKHHVNEAHFRLFAEQLVDLALAVVDHNTERFGDGRELYRHDAPLTTSEWRGMIDEHLSHDALEQRRLANIAALSPASRRKKYSFSMNASLSISNTTSPTGAAGAVAIGSPGTTSSQFPLPGGGAGGSIAASSNDVTQRSSTAAVPAVASVTATAAPTTTDTLAGVVTKEQVEIAQEERRVHAVFEEIEGILTATAALDSRQLVEFVDAAIGGTAGPKKPTVPPPPVHGHRDPQALLMAASSTGETPTVHVPPPVVAAVFVTGDDLSGVRLLESAPETLPDTIAAARIHGFEIVTPQVLRGEEEAARATAAATAAARATEATAAAAAAAGKGGGGDGKKGAANQAGQPGQPKGATGPGAQLAPPAAAAGKKAVTPVSSRVVTPTDGDGRPLSALLARRIAARFSELSLTNIEATHSVFFAKDEATKEPRSSPRDTDAQSATTADGATSAEGADGAAAPLRRLKAPHERRRLLLAGFPATPAFIADVASELKALEAADSSSFSRRRTVQISVVAEPSAAEKASAERAAAAATPSSLFLQQLQQQGKKGESEKPQVSDVTVTLHFGAMRDAIRGVVLGFDDVAHVSLLEGRILDTARFPTTVFHPAVNPMPSGPDATTARVAPWHTTMTHAELLVLLRQRRGAALEELVSLEKALRAEVDPTSGPAVLSQRCVLSYADLTRAGGKPPKLCNIIVDRIAGSLDSEVRWEPVLSSVHGDTSDSVSDSDPFPSPDAGAAAGLGDSGGDQAGEDRMSGARQFFAQKLSTFTQSLRENEMRIALQLRRSAEVAVKYFSLQYDGIDSLHHTRQQRWAYCDAQRQRDVETLGKIVGRATQLITPCTAARVVAMAHVLLEVCQQLVVDAGLRLVPPPSSNNSTPNRSASAATPSPDDVPSPHPVTVDVSAPIVNLASMVTLPTLDVADQAILSALDVASDAESLEHVYSQLLGDSVKKLRNAIAREHQHDPERARLVDQQFEACCKRLVPWFLTHQLHLDAVRGLLAQSCNAWSLRLFNGFNDLSNAAPAKPSNVIELLSISGGSGTGSPAATELGVDPSTMVLTPLQLRHLTHHLMMAAPLKIALLSSPSVDEANAPTSGGRALLTESEFVHGMLSAQVAALSLYLVVDEEDQENEFAELVLNGASSKENAATAAKSAKFAAGIAGQAEADAAEARQKALKASAAGLFLPPWWTTGPDATAETLDPAILVPLFRPSSLRTTFRAFIEDGGAAFAAEGAHGAKAPDASVEARLKAQPLLPCIHFLANMALGRVRVNSRPLASTQDALNLRPAKLPTITDIKTIVASFGSLTEPITSEETWLALPWWRMFGSTAADLKRQQIALKNLWSVLNWGKRHHHNVTQHGVSLLEVLPILCADVTTLKSIEKCFAAFGVVQLLGTQRQRRGLPHGGPYPPPAAATESAEVARALVASAQASTAASVSIEALRRVIPSLHQDDIAALVYLSANNNASLLKVLQSAAEGSAAVPINLAMLSSSHFGQALIKQSKVVVADVIM